MQFPEGFVEKYEAILEDEAREAFLPLLNKEAVSAFRVNPLKESQLSFADAIPHTPWGTMARFLESHQSTRPVLFISKSLQPKWWLR